MNVSRETRDKLKILAEMVLRWNRAINLISKSDRPHILDRHIVDSIGLYEACDQTPRRWCDLGSGGGFPGLVVACLSERAFPIVMIESDARKCVFLRSAIRELDLDATVIASRIEDSPPQGADVISARALSHLRQLLAYAHHHGTEQTTCLFPKGATFEREIEDASRDWIFEHRVIPSRTSDDGVILAIKGLTRV